MNFTFVYFKKNIGKETVKMALTPLTENFLEGTIITGAFRNFSAHTM